MQNSPQDLFCELSLFGENVDIVKIFKTRERNTKKTDLKREARKQKEREIIELN